MTAALQDRLGSIGEPTAGANFLINWNFRTIRFDKAAVIAKLKSSWT